MKRASTQFGEGFHQLLRLLDADDDRAAAAFVEVRRKLTKFFEWRGCVDAEYCADIALERVARRLAEGATVTSTPYAFIQGVAINVAREQFRQSERRHETLDEDVAAPVQSDPITRIDERKAENARRSCLAGCVRQLPTEQRRALLRYHAGEARSRIAARRELAATLGIPLQALRLRMFRIREGLERCILDCIGVVNAK